MLLETVKIYNGQIFNIEWHNRRLNHTRKELFKINEILNLQEYLNSVPPKGLFRCRILYAQEILSVEYIPYEIKSSKRFKIVQSDIDYSFKYANRELLNSLRDRAFDYDDIIIEKSGLLTDTTIANIAFYDGETWITPKKPLLEGTMRAKLLNSKFLVEKKIKQDDLRDFSNFALMNAMIGFQIVKKITID